MEDDFGVEQLTNMFKGRDWFHSVGHDQYGRLVVYTNFMCNETLHDVPDRVAGKQVLVHFAASMLATREQFTTSSANTLTPSGFMQTAREAQANGVDVGVGQIFDELELEVELDVDDLCRELDRLEKKCGAHTLMEVFFEIHDGKNAVTNMSSRYPEVREGMEKLYNLYGFDPIYNELEG